MDSPSPEPPGMSPQHRRMLWWTFWLLLLSTPFLAIATMLVRLPIRPPIPMLPPQLALAAFALLGGSMTCGFTLSKLYSKDTKQFVSRGIGFGCAIAAAYLAVGGVGCAGILYSFK